LQEEMKTEIGEYLVGAYLKIVKGCDFVDYNVRHPGGGLKGLNEIDVIGLDFKKKIAYLCEVTTHIGGLAYGKGYRDTVNRIKKKYKNLQDYALNHLGDFQPEFMFCSPVVPSGIAEELNKIEGLKLIINEDYSECINELRKKAGERSNDEGNPAFRLLQILEHMRKPKNL